MKTLRTLIDENPNKIIKASKNDVEHELNREKRGDPSTLLMRRLTDDTIVELPDTDSGWELSPDFAPVDALEAAKAEKYAEFEGQYQGMISQFSGGYSHEEMLSWDIQVQDAEAYNANPAASVKFLDRLAATRNKSKDEMQLRIRKKAASYTYGTAVLIGERQRCEVLLAQATTEAEIAAIQFSVPASFWADVQAEADAVV